MCQIERLENREENGGNTPDRYRALATWNSIKMNIYGFLQSTKGLKSPFHFEDGGHEIDSAILILERLTEHNQTKELHKLISDLRSLIQCVLGSFNCPKKNNSF